MTLLALGALMACVPVETPPAQWPPRGCAPEPLREEGGDRARDAWLEMDDGVRLRARWRLPKGVDCAPAVVLVPGGFEEGLSALDGTHADALVLRGGAVLAYDPRGRGESEGEEDHNGARGQSDLAQVLRWAAATEGVASEQVVLQTRSLGASLGTGALARNADLEPFAFVDYEGPASLTDALVHMSAHAQETLEGLALASSDPEAWWEERDASSYLPLVRVPYHRFQGLPDHALDRLDHVIAMLNAATGAPLATYNGQAITLPVSRDEVRAGAVEGGLDAQSPLITDAVLDLLDPR